LYLHPLIEDVALRLASLLLQGSAIANNPNTRLDSPHRRQDRDLFLTVVNRIYTLTQTIQVEHLQHGGTTHNEWAH
jgi:hypothetical protein